MLLPNESMLRWSQAAVSCIITLRLPAEYCCQVAAVTKAFRMKAGVCCLQRSFPSALVARKSVNHCGRNPWHLEQVWDRCCSPNDAAEFQSVCPFLHPSTALVRGLNQNPALGIHRSSQEMLVWFARLVFCWQPSLARSLRPLWSESRIFCTVTVSLIDQLHMSDG